MRHRIELHQGGKPIWKGAWAETPEEVALATKVATNDLKEALEPKSDYGFAMWRNEHDETTLIPKSILIGSIVVVAQEKPEQEEADDSTD